MDHVPRSDGSLDGPVVAATPHDPVPLGDDRFAGGLVRKALVGARRFTGLVPGRRRLGDEDEYNACAEAWLHEGAEGNCDAWRASSSSSFRP